jgi:DNA-directed RNA polymerase sigma subunit (sigma70/sigma32)
VDSSDHRTGDHESDPHHPPADPCGQGAQRLPAGGTRADAKLDHEPSPEEIANLLEKPVAEVKRMLGLNERVSSVDVSLGPDSDKTLLDTLTDDRPTDPCELLQDDDLSQSIDQWLGS